MKRNCYGMFIECWGIDGNLGNYNNLIDDVSDRPGMERPLNIVSSQRYMAHVECQSGVEIKCQFCHFYPLSHFLLSPISLLYPKSLFMRELFLYYRLNKMYVLVYHIHITSAFPFDLLRI